jgi:hypothetical protein
LLVQLRDDDFRAQVQQAEAGVASGEDALINNQRQKELQDGVPFLLLNFGTFGVTLNWTC